jgi:hypothetical protein
LESALPNLFTADFSESAAPVIADGIVERTGPIFEIRDYPEKGMKYSEEDADATIAAFKPVPNDLDHHAAAGRPTVLDGKLGTLAKIWRDGKTMFGTLAIPAPMNAILGADPIKVSLAFDAKNNIISNALTLRPHIKSAAVFTAFTEELTFGKSASVDLHDAAVRCGAECNGKVMFTDVRLFITPEDLALAQEVHDKTKGKGDCNCHAHATRMAGRFYTEERPAMNAWERFWARMRGETVTFTEADQREVESRLTPAPADIAADPRFSALQNLVNQQARDIALYATERIAVDAKRFYEDERAARRILPAEQAATIQAFTRAAEDDRDAPRTITFTDGANTRTGSRVEALRAQYAARPPHILFDEMEDPERVKQFATLAAQMETAQKGKPVPPTTARLSELSQKRVEMGLSPLSDNLTGNGANK